MFKNYQNYHGCLPWHQVSSFLKSQDIKGFPALRHSAAFLDLWTDWVIFSQHLNPWPPMLVSLHCHCITSSAKSDFSSQCCTALPEMHLYSNSNARGQVNCRVTSRHGPVLRKGAPSELLVLCQFWHRLQWDVEKTRSGVKNELPSWVFTQGFQLHYDLLLWRAEQSQSQWLCPLCRDNVQGSD